MQNKAFKKTSKICKKFKNWQQIKISEKSRFFRKIFFLETPLLLLRNKTHWYETKTFVKTESLVWNHCLLCLINELIAETGGQFVRLLIKWYIGIWVKLCLILISHSNEGVGTLFLKRVNFLPWGKRDSGTLTLNLEHRGSKLSLQQ